MKKFSAFISAVSIFSLFASFTTPLASAGGYCATWVKTARNTPVASMQTAGTNFVASVFDIKAGVLADAVINSVKITKKGIINNSDITKISVSDMNGQIYGTAAQFSNSNTVLISLTQPFIVPVNTTVRMKISIQTKLFGGSGGTITVGLMDLYGTTKPHTYYGRNDSIYCSSYGVIKDSVFGTDHVILKSPPLILKLLK